QDHLARQMLKLPHLKYFTLITGMTLGHHVEIERKLQMAIPHLQNVLNLEESDFILVFCPVVSHAANNIEAAVNMLSTEAGNKPAVLVVLHHTFDPEHIVPDSSRSVKRQNMITVDCLFHEDQGLLTCFKNKEALTKVINWLHPEGISNKPPSQHQSNKPAVLVVLHHTFDPEHIVPDSSRSVKRQNTITIDCLFHEDQRLLTCFKNDEALSKVINWIECMIASSHIYLAYQDNPATQMLKISHLKYYTLVTGNTLGHDMGIERKLEERIPGLKKVLNLEESDFILVFCPVVSRAGTDIEAAVKKLSIHAGNKPAVLVVLHHTFDPEHIVPDSSRSVKRQNTITIDYLFHEDQRLLTYFKNEEALSKVINWLHPEGISNKPPSQHQSGACPEHLPRETSRRHTKQMLEPPQLSPFDVEEQRLYSELLPGDRAPYPISMGAPHHPTGEAHFGRLYPGSYPFGYDQELMTIDQDNPATQMLKISHLKYYTLVTGNTLGHDMGIERKLEERIPGLKKVLNLEESDFILVFCPVVSRAGTDIEAAVKKLSIHAGNKPAVLVVLHHTFDPEHIVPDSSRSVKRQNTITIDYLFHEDQRLLTYFKNEEALSKVINWLHPELFRRDSEAFPGQPRDIVSPACPGSSPGSLPGGACPEHLPRETSRRHTKQMLEPPQLSPFDVEEQRLYSELLPGDRAPYPISMGAPHHPTGEAHFGRLYPGSYPFGYDQELMTIDQDNPAKQMLKNSHLKYYTLVTGNTLGHDMGIERKLEERIPGLKKVLNLEESDFILLFCPVADIEAAVKKLTTQADQDNPATQMLKISHLKYYTLVTGNTLGHDMGIERKLEERIPGLKKVLNLEESDFILVFCPVVSRAGTDIEAAVKKLSIHADQDNPAKQMLKNSHLKYCTLGTGNTLGHDMGIERKLEERIPGLKKVLNLEESDFILLFCPVADIEAAVKKLTTQAGNKPAVLVVLHHTLDPENIVPDSSRSVKRQNMITVDCLFHEDQGLLTCFKNKEALSKVINWIEDIPKRTPRKSPNQDNPATQMLKISHLKYYTLVTGNTLGHDMGIERKLEERIPGLKKVLNLEESDFILVFCPVVSRAGTDIEAAVKKLSIHAGNKPAVLVVLHHTFDPEHIVPDSSRSVKRQNTITVDCLFHEDQRLLTCFKNKEALSKVINWLHPEDISNKPPSQHQNQDNPATQMLKISHLKYYTLVTGNTLGHDMGIERKLEEQIPGLKKVLNLEESDFILVFCPVVSRAGTDIEAAVKKLSIHAGNKPAVLVVLHHTFDPEHIVPDSSRSVKRQNTITVDYLFHEDQGLLTCFKNKEALTKVINWLHPEGISNKPLSQHQNQDNPAKQMLKNSHLKYCTLGTGNTLGHDMGIERKLEERIPGLKKVLNLEESDFILLFCPVADIEAAVKKLTTQAGNKPAVLVVLHHTFDPEHIVPDSSRSVKRQNMITVDCLFHEDQGLLTCFKNKEALSKVINWIEDIPKRTPRKSPNQDHLARQMLKLPHLKYFTLITGKTLGHHVEIERKLQMAIPHLQNVLNLEESDFILVFCPVVSHAANNIEAAVNMLSTKAGNKRAVLVVLHHTFDPELIVPDSSRSVKRQNTITVDCLFHEDQGLLTCLKNEEALSKVTNWLYPKIEKNPEKNDPFDKLKESQKYNQDVQQVGNQAQGEGEHNECCKDQGLTNQKKENTAQNEDIVQKQLEKNSGQEEKKSGLTENGVKKDNTDPVENECQGEKNDKPEEKNTVDGMTAQSEKEKSQEEEKQGHSKSEEQSFQEPCLQNEKKEEQDEDMKGNQREKGQEQEEYTGEPGGKKSEVTKDHLEDSAVNIEQVQKNENQGENNDEPEEKNIQADEATAACEKEKSQVDKKAREPREQVKEGENDVEPEENVQRGGKGSQDISDHKRAETTEADQQETRTAKKKEKFRFGKKRNHGDNQGKAQYKRNTLNDEVV
ncbi:hypothetical protein QTP70_020202, partial [Hemibagrus guttatus]